MDCALQGQIDALFLDVDCKLPVANWKRVRNLGTEGFDPLRYPLDHLPDTNFWMYSMQLNLYRYILETEYGLAVSCMYLAIVHPELPCPRLVQVPPLDAEISELHAYEREQGRATHSAGSWDDPFVL